MRSWVQSPAPPKQQIQKKEKEHLEAEAVLGLSSREVVLARFVCEPFLRMQVSGGWSDGADTSFQLGLRAISVAKREPQDGG